MLSEELNDLYKLLRGNKAAAKVLEARTLALDNKLSQVLEKIAEARVSYENSRSRFLKPGIVDQVTGKGAEADRKRKTLKRKHDKTVEALKAFDEIVPKIEREVDRTAKRRQLESIGQTAAPQPAEVGPTKIDSAQTQSQSSNPAPLGERPTASSERPSDLPTGTDDADDRMPHSDTVINEQATKDTQVHRPRTKSPTHDKPSAPLAPPATPDQPGVPASRSDLTAEFVEAYQTMMLVNAVAKDDPSAVMDDSLLDLVNDNFDFAPVVSPLDVRSEALYLVRTTDCTYLVETGRREPNSERIELNDVMKDRKMKPFTVDQFIKLGKRRKLVLLIRRTQPVSASN